MVGLNYVHNTFTSSVSKPLYWVYIYWLISDLMTQYMAYFPSLVSFVTTLTSKPHETLNTVLITNPQFSKKKKILKCLLIQTTILIKLCHSLCWTVSLKNAGKVTVISKMTKMIWPKSTQRMLGKELGNKRILVNGANNTESTA